MKRKLAIAVVIIVVAAVTALGIAWVREHYASASDSAEPDRSLYPVRGIDVSAHNGAIDFAKVKADGFDFVIAKATEGTNFKDRYFVDNAREAAANGLKTGAYHFFRFDTDGRMQAINILHSIRNRHLDFPIIIDVEEWGNPEGNATAQIVKRLRDLIDHLEFYGRQVMLYTNKDGYDRFISGNFDNYPLWICTFGQPDENLEWAMWQYSHRGKVDGIDGKVDLNTINTSDSRLKQ